MTLRSRLFVLLSGALLVASPLFAQGNSDVSGAVPASDVSGNLTQSDLFFFQSDEARIRMAEVAASLSQALREGTLGASLTGEGPMVVPDGMAALFLAASRTDRHRSAQQLTETLTAEGIPSGEARALARSTSGILAGDTVDAEQFAAALHAFNDVVDVAPTPFLAGPPQSFVVLRIVMTTLLDGAGGV